MKTYDWLIVGSGFGGQQRYGRRSRAIIRLRKFPSLRWLDRAGQPGRQPFLTITALAEHAMSNVSAAASGRTEVATTAMPASNTAAAL